jgi:transposase
VFKGIDLTTSWVEAKVITKKISDERIQEYLELYSLGWSHAKIGEKFNRSPEAIRENLKNRGLLRSRGVGRNNQNNNPERIKKAESAYKLGLTLAECAERFKVSESTICRHIETRSYIEASKKASGKPTLAAEYYRFYEAGYSTRQIAEMYGQNPASIKKLLHNHGYKLRTRSEAAQLVNKPRNLTPSVILPAAPNFVAIGSNKPCRKISKPKRINTYADKIAAFEAEQTKEAMEAIRQGQNS